MNSQAPISHYEGLELEPGAQLEGGTGGAHPLLHLAKDMSLIEAQHIIHLD